MLNNRYTRIEDKLQSRILTAADDREVKIYNALIRQWNRGAIAASTWVILEDGSIVDRVVAETPLETSWCNPGVNGCWYAIKPVLISIAKEKGV